MADQGHRSAGVFMPTELEARAREVNGLDYLSLSALIRVSVSVLAGDPLPVALSKYARYTPARRKVVDS